MALSEKKQAETANVFPQLLAPTSIVPVPFKSNSGQLPVIILPDHTLLVEALSPLFQTIYPHLCAFAEPIYRPKRIQQYRITKFSLYTAMVLRYTGQEIIAILNRVCKNETIPPALEAEITGFMSYSGKARFRLQKGAYYLYTTKDIACCVKDKLLEVSQVVEPVQPKLHLQNIRKELSRVDPTDDISLDSDLEENQPSDEVTKLSVLTKYAIQGSYFDVTSALVAKNIPIVQQYDFLRDNNTRSIQIELGSEVRLRYHQQRAMRNIFIGNQARSGIVVLPCGAGKSLVGIAAIQRVKKPAVIFCESQVSAQQWKSELFRWTNIDRDKVLVFSPKFRDKNPKKIQECSIFITTYSMVGLRRVVENQYLELAEKQIWGTCIADQVHKLPAETFQSVLMKFKFHLKIGLTATPYREDQKISNLYYMIGPKLYEESWLNLVREGCLARPYCVQILCEMPESFRKLYNSTNSSDLIHTANPAKFKVLQYLLKKHLHCNDKILVFCDRPKIIEEYARKLRVPFIHGQVGEEERVKVYNLFKTTRDINVLFLSRVGDTAIDLPCASVGIQLGMHFGSRRQQIQRMGRIMRAKDNQSDEFNAFFYTLVSSDTREAQFSCVRQKCLIDQGFQVEIKKAEQLDYSGMKFVELDEQEYLFRILTDHEQGNQILSLARERQAVQTVRIQNQQLTDFIFQEDPPLS